MDTKIQFRVDPSIKELAQRTAQRKGVTLSDVYREFTEQLAREQKSFESKGSWLDEQIDQTFAALDRGEITFISEDEAKERIRRRREEFLLKHGK